MYNSDKAGRVRFPRLRWQGIFAGFALAGSVSAVAAPQAATWPATGRVFHGVAAENGTPVPHICSKVERAGRMVLRCGPSVAAEGIVHGSRIVRLHQPDRSIAAAPSMTVRANNLLPDPTRRLGAKASQGQFPDSQPAPDPSLSAGLTWDTEVLPGRRAPVSAPPPKLVVERVPNGYLVASTGDASLVLQTLRSVGDGDHQILSRGPYRGRISLGVFSVRANAQRRAASLERHGINAELILRTREVVHHTRPSGPTTPLASRH